MLIWRGWGILVVLIGFGLLVATQALVDAVAGRGAYTRESALWAPIAIVAAGAIVLVIGRALNGRPPRELVDKQTGEQVVLRPDNSLFFIKMEYWGVLMLVGGVLAFVVGLIQR